MKNKTKFAVRVQRNGEYVKRYFTSPSGCHYTKNAKSAFTSTDRESAVAHMETAMLYMRREVLEVVEI